MSSQKTQEHSKQDTELTELIQTVVCVNDFVFCFNRQLICLSASLHNFLLSINQNQSDRVLCSGCDVLHNTAAGGWHKDKNQTDCFPKLAHHPIKVCQLGGPQYSQLQAEAAEQCLEPLCTCMHLNGRN